MKISTSNSKTNVLKLWWWLISFFPYAKKPIAFRILHSVGERQVITFKYEALSAVLIRCRFDFFCTFRRCDIVYSTNFFKSFHATGLFLLSIPSQYIRQPTVIWCFQSVKKETYGMGLKIFQKCLFSFKMFTVFIYWMLGP